MVTILWRNIIFVGHESCRLFKQDETWHLDGCCVFSYDHTPCQLSYHVTCDAAWLTQSAVVEGWLGDEKITKHIRTDQNHQWWLNDSEVPGVAGCTDIDLNFSPSTNTLPIRRLKLSVGEGKNITAAWLKFPAFTLEPLPQSYSRVDETLYRYESGGGSFKADLLVNPSGFVLEYPGLWIAEASSN